MRGFWLNMAAISAAVKVLGGYPDGKRAVEACVAGSVMHSRGVGGKIEVSVMEWELQTGVEVSSEVARQLACLPGHATPGTLPAQTNRGSSQSQAGVGGQRRIVLQIRAYVNRPDARGLASGMRWGSMPDVRHLSKLE